MISMKIKSNVKAGIGSATGGAGAGRMPKNHNQTVSRGLKVKTNVKAGIVERKAGGDPLSAGKPF
jgi:hypothetical protein